MSTVTPLHTASERALADISCRVVERGHGDFQAVIALDGADPLPARIFDGEFVPRKVLLLWRTFDGRTWTFAQAIVFGVYIDKHTGQPGLMPCSQTYHLMSKDRPVWLPALVDAHAPQQTTEETR